MDPLIWFWVAIAQTISINIYGRDGHRTTDCQNQSWKNRDGDYDGGNISPPIKNRSMVVRGGFWYWWEDIDTGLEVQIDRYIERESICGSPWTKTARPEVHVVLPRWAAPLGSTSVVLHLVHRPHRPLHVLHSHKALVQRQVVPHCVLT